MYVECDNNARHYRKIVRRAMVLLNMKNRYHLWTHNRLNKIFSIVILTLLLTSGYAYYGNSHSSYHTYIRAKTFLGNYFRKMSQTYSISINMNKNNNNTSMQYMHRSRMQYPVIYGGKVKYTLNLYNNSLINGNFLGDNQRYPISLCYDSKNQLLYVADTESNNVSVIDVKNNLVIDNISVGFGPSEMAINNLTGYLYVLNSGSMNIDVINTTSNKIVTTIPSVSYPEDIIYDPVNNNLYFGYMAIVSNKWVPRVSVINGNTNKIIANISVNSIPYGMVYDSYNGYIYLADNNISVINPSTNTIINTIYPYSSSYMLTDDPSNNYIYSIPFGNVVTAINSLTNKIVANITMISPLNSAYASSNGYIYVTSYDGDNITGINTTTNQIVYNIGAGIHPVGIIYVPYNKYIYVANSASDNLTVIDTLNNNVFKNIPIGSVPFGITYDSSSGNIYNTNWESNSVSLIDFKSNKITKSINLPNIPSGLTYDPKNGNIYIFDFVQNRISTINGATDTFLTNIPTGPAVTYSGSIVFLYEDAQPLAYDSYNNLLYAPYSKIMSNGGGSVSGASAVNTTDNSIITNITAYKYSVTPNGIAYDSVNHNIYVSNWAGTISVISSSNMLVKNISLGGYGGADGLAYDPVNNFLYVARFWSNVVSVINCTSNALIGNITVGYEPTAVAYDPSNGFIYVTNSYSNNVSVIVPYYNGYGKADWSINVGYAPTCITYNSVNGFIYVSNFYSGTISIIDTGRTPIPVYNITIKEYGLNQDTKWGVSLSGNAQYSSYPSISFMELNGTYSFNVSNITGYIATPAAGIIKVNNSNITKTITFTHEYMVIFMENGLPAGTLWSVNTSTGSYNSTLPTIFTNLTNGTYPYTASTVNKNYAPIPLSGTITVNGSPINRTIVFATFTYKVTFKEKYLPAGTLWSVTLGGATTSSSTSSITFTEPNGTYLFTAGIVTGFNASPPSGIITINGGSQIKTIMYNQTELAVYTVTFTESGLAARINWSVTLNNITEFSNTNSIIFKERIGSFTYKVSNILGYKVYPSYGNISINGTNLSVGITFYNVGRSYIQNTNFITLMDIAIIVIVILITLVIVLLLIKKRKKNATHNTQNQKLPVEHD